MNYNLGRKQFLLRKQAPVRYVYLPDMCITTYLGYLSPAAWKVINISTSKIKVKYFSFWFLSKWFLKFVGSLRSEILFKRLTTWNHLMTYMYIQTCVCEILIFSIQAVWQRTIMPGRSGMRWRDFPYYPFWLKGSFEQICTDTQYKI